MQLLDWKIDWQYFMLLPPWLPLIENIIETPHTTTIVKSGQKLLITLKSGSGVVTCSQPSPDSEKIRRRVNEPGTDRTQGRDVRVAHLWQRRKGKTGPPHNQSCKGLIFMQISGHGTFTKPPYNKWNARRKMLKNVEDMFDWNFRLL